MKKLNILKNLTVLYVDDDKEACESLKQILQYYFKTVLIAHNGEDAFEIYKTKRCDLLIVDYDMPIMNGYEFLLKVREKDDKVLAFIMSSYDDKIKLKNAIKLNLLDYLVKPYELNELKKLLSKCANLVEAKNLLHYQISENCYYDMMQKCIFNNKQRDNLTSYEIKILEYLLKNKNKVISYEILLDMIDSNSQKSLVSIVHKINKKLPFKIVENVKDIGYVLKI